MAVSYDCEKVQFDIEHVITQFWTGMLIPLCGLYPVCMAVILNLYVLHTSLLGLNEPREVWSWEVRCLRMWMCNGFS
jgi:hypothetical protein